MHAGKLNTLIAASLLVPPACAPAEAPAADRHIEQAYAEQRSNVQVQGEGVVVRVLPDDNRGSRHQRLLLRLESGQTLLIAHNIDLSRRVRGVQPGDRLRFVGEYEWNPQGGVIHWTHRDPGGEHPSGWIEHRGRRYD